VPSVGHRAIGRSSPRVASRPACPGAAVRLPGQASSPAAWAIVGTRASSAPHVVPAARHPSVHTCAAASTPRSRALNARAHTARTRRCAVVRSSRPWSARSRPGHRCDPMPAVPNFRPAPLIARSSPLPRCPGTASAAWSRKTARVGLEALPQGPQRGLRCVPAALGGAGEFRPRRQPECRSWSRARSGWPGWRHARHGRLDPGRRLVPVITERSSHFLHSRRSPHSAMAAPRARQPNEP